jgi:hypothetical protein
MARHNCGFAVMASRNGAVAQPAVFRLGDLTAERREVQFERGGEVVTVRAYASGKARLSSVVAELSAAYDRWQAAIGTAENTQAYLKYRRDCLAAVIPIGMEEAEIDALAADTERYHALMVYLGWEQETEAADDSPEARREESPSTGADSSPSSPASTTSEQASS